MSPIRSAATSAFTSPWASHLAPAPGCFDGANGAVRALLRRAQELASGIRVLWPDHDLMGSHRRQAVAGPSATVRQSRQTFDTRTTQPRAKQLSFGLGPDYLDDDQLVHNNATLSEC